MVFFILCLFFFVLILTCRVHCNRCGASHKNMKLTRTTLNTPLIILLIGAAIFTAAAGVTGYGNVYIFEGVKHATDKLEDEAQEAKNNVQQIGVLLSQINGGKKTVEGNEFLVNYDEIIKLEVEVDAIKKKSDEFSFDAYSFEVGRFVWIWVQIFITAVSIGMGIAGYIPFKSAGYLIAATVVLFFAFAELFLHMAYCTSQLFVTTDICEQIYDIVHENKVPVEDEGIGYFLKPFSYVNNI